MYPKKIKLLVSLVRTVRKDPLESGCNIIKNTVALKEWGQWTKGNEYRKQCCRRAYGFSILTGHRWVLAIMLENRENSWVTGLAVMPLLEMEQEEKLWFCFVFNYRNSFTAVMILNHLCPITFIHLLFSYCLFLSQALSVSTYKFHTYCCIF